MWRPVVLPHQGPREQAGWAELELHPEWLAAGLDHRMESSNRPSSLVIGSCRRAHTKHADDDFLSSTVATGASRG